MKPRRFVSATTFSINWSRGTVKLGCHSPAGATASRLSRPPHTVGRRVQFSPSALLQDAEDVTGRVLEPGDVRTSTCRCAAGDTFGIRQLAVVLELDAFADQSIHRLVDVVDGEVEDRVGRGNVVGLGVNKKGVSSRNLQAQALRTLFDIEAKRSAVKLFRHSEVVHRKTAERPGVLEHLKPPSSGEGTVAISGAGPGDAQAAPSTHPRSRRSVHPRASSDGRFEYRRLPST